MPPEHTPVDRSEKPVAPADAALDLLQLAARLMLEYSVRTETIKRRISRLAEHLGVSVSTSVAYREVTLFVGDRSAFNRQVPELRLNVAVNLVTESVIDELCAHGIGVEEAARRLRSIGRMAPEYGRWVLALIFGAAGSALAWLLRADWTAVALSGVSSGLGLIVRQELAKRHVIFFALPFAAALIGAILGGIAISAGWTHTPGLCLIVPALMLVPGPHLIHSVQEMLENHIQAGMFRLGLAVSILLAATLGVLLGARMTVGVMGVGANPSEGMQLTLPLDITLAGAAACGFGAFYNTPPRILWVSILCGMIGHGTRYLCMEEGVSQEIATLLACFAIGGVAEIAADSMRIPFATVAFAGAVPMMPGVFIYEGFAKALRMAAGGTTADPGLAAASLALLAKAVFVVGAMAFGLLLGAWVAGLVAGRARRLDGRRGAV